MSNTELYSKVVAYFNSRSAPYENVIIEEVIYFYFSSESGNNLFNVIKNRHGSRINTINAIHQLVIAINCAMQVQDELNKNALITPDYNRPVKLSVSKLKSVSSRYTDYLTAFRNSLFITVTDEVIKQYEDANVNNVALKEAADKLLDDLPIM